MASSEYYYSNPVLNSSTDSLSVTLGQTTGTTWYTPSGMSGVTFYLVPSNVSFTGPYTPGAISAGMTLSTMTSGQTEHLTFTHVFGTSSISPGTTFHGYIYAVYLTSSDNSSYLLLATIKVKST